MKLLLSELLYRNKLASVIVVYLHLHAFAYHAARGDKVEELTFDQASMRKHLVKCFEDEKFTPFPQTSDPVFKSASSTVHLSLYCCRMPECYDSMVCCDICNLWYHFKCAGIIYTCKPTQ